MRQIYLTKDCLDFIDSQDERVYLKFWQLVEVMTEIKVINSNFVKKLENTQFYELRIKAGNEYRVILFAIDDLNFNECTKAVCLNGFHKKSTKDYRKAIKTAERNLEKYLNEK
ncbi:MAG: type II toxin-antitoxin system RelE/ParE family toxin [Bacteroidetes bacterium]|nr:type II toxin-antitoxin system RelE/ParE family toxin [Bacteroidota bacterium]